MDTFSAETYRAIFEASPDGVLVVDREGTVRQVNAAAEALFGYSRRELAGRSVELLVPASLRAVHVQHRRRYMESPRARPMGIGMELRGLRRDGTEFPVEISLSPLEVEGGERLVIATARDVTRGRRLRDFSAGALRATEEERQRIARELHDDTAQRLSGLLVALRLLKQAPAEGHDREARFEEFRRDLAEAAESVRRVARGLRPPELQDAGLAAAIRAHVRGLQESGGLEVDLELEPVDHLLAADATLVLYRILQEALSNVLRHSGATRARVEVRRAEALVLASVQDEGRGFEPGAHDGAGGGLGLLGMEERAAMVGGRVEIESGHGRGTRVRVSIPVEFTEGVKSG